MSTRQSATMSAGIRLRDVLPQAKTVGSSNVVFHSACGQWNECQPEDVFVAVNGSDCDGHDFAIDAVERGASAVVGERLMPIQKPQFLVDDSRAAYGTICHALAGNPSQRLATIGVSGTDGKTVTAHLIHSILQSAGNSAGLSSSIETRFGRKAETAQATVTSPIVAEQLCKMALGDCSYAVVEADPIALARHAISGVALDAAVLTNIRRGNLDQHGSNENYRRNTARLLDYVKSTGFAIVNADDKESFRILDVCPTPTLTFGIHEHAEVTAKLLDRNYNWQTFILSAGTESIPVRTQIIGKQHIYNCLAAAATALTFGFDLETIARGLEAARIPGRLERVDCGQPFGVWIDSALSPSQLSVAISAIGQVCEGKVWCVCSTDSCQSSEQRRRIGEILERKTEKSVITQSRICDVVDYEPAHQILDGFEKPARTRFMPNRVKAIDWVLSQAGRKDSVLIAGCGERSVGVAAENWTVTDRDFCQAWLYDHRSVETPPNRHQIYKIDDYR
jgi:UDP-N-acetylmuramoyl-L-alanyl-D-glutamate--2,6-diaminopimelate ligase